MRRAHFVAVLALFLCAPSVRDASASGFLVARFGSEFGHPTTDHLSGIYFNPAGLALRSGWRLQAEGLFGWRTATYDRPISAIDNILRPGEEGTGTPSDAERANAGTANLSDPVAAPFFGVATDLGVPNLGVGLAFYVPFGGQAVWDENPQYVGNTDYPGAVDGPQRWATIEGTLRSMYVTAAGAYRLPAQRLSVGLGVNLVWSEIDVLRARNPSGTDDLVTSDGLIVEGRSLASADGLTLSLGAGVIWQPRDTIWLGLSYQSQPGFGKLSLEGTLTNKFGAAAAAPTPLAFEQELPDVWRLGGRWRPIPRAEVRLFGEYVRWSVFERQCLLDASNPDRKCALTETGAVDTAAGGAGIQANIERDWNDAFGLRAGASYWVRPSYEVFAGVGYDGNAVPDETIDAGLMDMQKVTWSVGGRIGLLGNRLGVTASWLEVFYFDRTVPAPPRDADGKLMTADPPTRVPSGAGSYSQWVGVLTLGLEYAF